MKKKNLLFTGVWILNVKMQLVLLLVFGFAFVSCEKEIKVACIGDSITEGFGLKQQSVTAYPVVLNKLLGNNYAVLNSGRSATTLQKKGDFPFWICKEFSNVFVFKPEIIIIKLGTNDTKPHNWNEQQYRLDYQSLIDTLNTLSTKPKIYLCYPVPVFETRWGINDSTVINGIIPTIDKLSDFNQLPVIDLYHPMMDQSANFPDHIHPNEEAVVKMAEIIAKSIQT